MKSTSARSRDLGRALEVQDPELGTQLEVRPRLEVEARRLAHAAHLDVGGRVAPSGYGSVRDVGDDEKRLANRLFDFCLPGGETVDFLRKRLGLRTEWQGSRLFRLAYVPSYIQADLFVLVSQRLDAGDQRPPLEVECRKVDRRLLA